LWVRFLCRLHRMDQAEQALNSLAELCRDGLETEWEFNEWAHGVTGRPMGKSYQAWSAASYVAAYLRFQGDVSSEVSDERPEELIVRDEEGVDRRVTNRRVDLDRDLPEDDED